jgi:hypothetical protein
MTEEFTFQQRTRNRRAVEGYETILAARAGLMNGLCDHFFSGSGFALHQDGGVYRRNHVDLVKHSPEFRTGSNQIESSHRFTPLTAAISAEPSPQPYGLLQVGARHRTVDTENQQRLRRVSSVILHFVSDSCVHAFPAKKTRTAARTIVCSERIMT